MIIRTGIVTAVNRYENEGGRHTLTFSEIVYFKKYWLTLKTVRGDTSEKKTPSISVGGEEGEVVN